MEATTTDIIPVIDTSQPIIDNSIIISSDVMVPLETQFFTSSFGSSTTIDTILADYFSIFPTFYFLILIAIGISALLIYTLYSYLDNL